MVLIDPNENPDGRERFTHDLERMTSSAGIASDPQAQNNAGSWPGPRTSHYYFDLNRDWFTQSHPESKGRVRTVPGVDAAGGRRPARAGLERHVLLRAAARARQPQQPKNLPKWFDIFAAAHGAAFDAHGWSYFPA